MNFKIKCCSSGHCRWILNKLIEKIWRHNAHLLIMLHPPRLQILVKNNFVIKLGTLHVSNIFCLWIVVLSLELDQCWSWSKDDNLAQRLLTHWLPKTSSFGFIIECSWWELMIQSSESKSVILPRAEKIITIPVNQIPVRFNSNSIRKCPD